MALDINGYSDTFRAFTDFATQAKSGSTFAQIDGEKSAVGGTGSLAGRTIVAKTAFDFAGNVGRRTESSGVNNDVRALFKRAIEDMFGGADKIPKSVQDAMKLQDFGKGKPLSARRILAVKTAIDKDGTMVQKAFDESISVFKSADTEKAALDMGYAKGELPKIAKAVNLYAETTGCSEAEALKEVSTPGSKANRLMNYGGRFLQSADNFKNGMRLLDSFGTWFDETRAQMVDINRNDGSKYRDDMSMTLLNASHSVFDNTGNSKNSVERFVFEELANNPSANLAEEDPEKLFGMEHNEAMRSIGRHFSYTRAQTMAQIPPEKRTTFFKALNLLCPPYASTAEEARKPGWQRKALTSSSLDIPVARILKNLDQVLALEKGGKLTAAKLVKLCFPEISEPGDNPGKDVYNIVNKFYNDLDLGGEGTGIYGEGNGGPMLEIMKSTGCSADDAYEVSQGNKKIENVPYFSSGTMGLADLGSLKAGRDQLAGDLTRPKNYGYRGSGDLLKKDSGFTFNFPGGESIKAGATQEGRATVPTILDKLEALCGPVHKEQAASVMLMTCQSGLAALRESLAPYGVTCDEHSVVDFTLSKNEETGDISIRYSSPKELPFSFEWTATIKPDGNVSTTPLRFTHAETLESECAETAKAIANARYIKGKAPEVKEKVVNTIMEQVRSDSDLMALLRMHNGYVATSVAVNGASQIRSPEKIRQNIEELRANIEELRIASKGNKRLFDAGLKQLSLLGGTAFASGVITKMCEMAAKVDFASLKLNGLSASSSPEAICDAVCNLDREVHRMFNETSLMARFGKDLNSIDSPGAAERFGSTSMALSFLLASADDKTLANINNALHSGNTQKMVAALQNLSDGRFPQGSSIEPARRLAISSAAQTNSQFVDEIVGTLDDMLGLGDPAEESEGQRYVAPSVDAKTAQKVFDRMEQHTLEVHSGMIDLEQQRMDGARTGGNLQQINP